MVAKNTWKSSERTVYLCYEVYLLNTFLYLFNLLNKKLKNKMEKKFTGKIG